MMDRRRISSSIAGLLIAAAIAWFFTCQNAPPRPRTGGTAPPAKEDRESRRNGSASKELKGLTPVPLSPPAVPSKSCRELLFGALLKPRMRPGYVALSLNALHRGNGDFIEMADAFCKQAGDNLVPICRGLLSDLESESSSALVAAILGHSKREDAFDLLKELLEQGKGPPESRELFSSAVYSIGMIRSPQSAPFLLKLYSETPDARKSFSERFGTPLMAALGMCGSEGVRVLKEAALMELKSEDQPTWEEGLRWYRWSHLGLVNSPEAFGELKSIASQESDIRLRGMAIAAMGQSSDPEQRAYLAELYSRDTSPEIRRAILEALRDGAGSSSIEWEAMRTRLAGPLASILKDTRLPSGNEMTDYAAISLACAANTPESAAYMNEWIRVASNGAYGASEYDWIDIAVRALAAQGASMDRIDALLEGKGVSAQDRISYLSGLVNFSMAPAGGTKHVREIIDYLDKAKERDATFFNALHALGRIPEAQEELETCIDRMVAREQGGWRINSIKAAESAGEAGLRPLERLIRTSQELPEILQASQVYLSALPQGVDLNTDVGDRMRALFSSRAIESFLNGVLAPHSESPGAFARTVGLYFSRFGTPQDIAWLDRLPQLMNGVRNVREDHLARFRQELAWECARAADAIRLRSN